MKRVRRWLPSFLLVLPSIILVSRMRSQFTSKESKVHKTIINSQVECPPFTSPGTVKLSSLPLRESMDTLRDQKPQL